MLPPFFPSDILRNFDAVMKPFLKFPKEDRVSLFKKAYGMILQNPECATYQYIRLFREYALEMYEMTDTDVDEEIFVNDFVREFFPSIKFSYGYNIPCRIDKDQPTRTPGCEVAEIKPSYFEAVHHLPGGITPVEFVLAAQKLNFLRAHDITNTIRFLRKPHYDLQYIFRYSSNPVVNGDLMLPVIGNSYMRIRHPLGEPRCSLQSGDKMALNVLNRRVRIINKLTQNRSINGKRIITEKTQLKSHVQHPLTEEDTITNLHTRLNNTMDVIKGLYQKGYNFQYQTDLYKTELERLHGICGPLYAKLCEKLDDEKHTLLQRLILQLCSRASLIFQMIKLCEVDHSYFATIPSFFLNDLRKPETIRFPSSSLFEKIQFPSIIFHHCIPFLELILNKYIANERYPEIVALVAQNMTYFNRSIEYLRMKPDHVLIPQSLAELLYVEISLLDRLTYFANFQTMNQKTPSFNSRTIIFKKILNHIHDRVFLGYLKPMNVYQALYYKDDVIEMSSLLDNMRFKRFIELLYMMQYFLQRILSISAQSEPKILFAIDDQGNASITDPYTGRPFDVVFDHKYSVIFIE